MAAALGTVASGMAVVSLAIQMAESIKKIKDFCKLVKSAPNDILLALEELETTSLILEDIDHSVQNSFLLDSKAKLAVTKAYNLCQNSRDALSHLVSSLQNEGKKSKRANIRVALNKSKMDEMSQCIERARATMMLANQIYYQAEQKQRWERLTYDIVDMRASHQLQYNTLEHGVREVQSILSQRIESTTEVKPASTSIPGTGRDTVSEKLQNEVEIVRRQAYPRPAFAYSQKRRRFYEQDSRNILPGILSMVVSTGEGAAMFSIQFSFPTWIYARRYEINLLRSTYGWDQRLRSYRVIPYHSTVFQYSKEGNIEGLQRLFERREASPFEVDEGGKTPLHYAAAYARPDTCRFLVENGADLNARTSLGPRHDWEELFERAPTVVHAEKAPDLFLDGGIPSSMSPFQLASGLSGALSRSGRQAYSSLYGHSSRPIDDDIDDTVRVLYESGSEAFDGSLDDGFNAFQLFSGSLKTLGWLRQQEEAVFSSMSLSELIRLVYNYQDNRDPTPDYILEILPKEDLFRDVALAHSQDEKGSRISLLLLVIQGWIYVLLQPDGYPGWEGVHERWAQLIVKLIKLGSPVHILSKDPESRTPTFLSFMISIGLQVHYVFEKKTNFDRSVVNWWLKCWFDLLYEGGVDLVEYVREEQAIKDAWDVAANERGAERLMPNAIPLEPESEYPNLCVVEIVGIKVEEMPKRLRVIYEDLWFLSPMAAEFWAWVEGDYEGWLSTDFEEARMMGEGEGTMPGSWPEEV